MLLGAGGAAAGGFGSELVAEYGARLLNEVGGSTDSRNECGVWWRGLPIPKRVKRAKFTNTSDDETC